MARNGDKSVTWQQVGVTFVIFIALSASIWKMAAVSAESKDAITNVEKAQEAKHKIHNDNKFAHEPMRQMFREELNDAMAAQTTVILDAINGKKN